MYCKKQIVIPLFDENYREKAGTTAKTKKLMDFFQRECTDCAIQLMLLSLLLYLSLLKRLYSWYASGAFKILCKLSNGGMKDPIKATVNKKNLMT